jgi:hypothetical protein
MILSQKVGLSLRAGRARKRFNPFPKQINPVLLNPERA